MSPRRPTDLTKLHYKQVGKTKYGFMRDRKGTGYLLCFISHNGSDNLLATDVDRGLEYQSCLLDGFIDHAAGETFFYNTTNPTHGGGNYGNAVPDVIMIEETETRVSVDLPAFDYMPNRGEMGEYKTRMLAGRYPDCGWRCSVVYDLTETRVDMSVKYYMTDNQLHRVYFFRPMTIHLNPKLFQYPLENEDKRDENSYLAAVIKDDNIRVKSIDRKFLLTLSSRVNNLAQYRGAKPYYSHRCFIEADRMVQNKVGTGDVWEAMLVIEPQRAYSPDTVFEGNTTLEITPLRFGVDLRQILKNLIIAVNERMRRMKIECKDGPKTVTDNQFVWLESTGKLVDMSSHPGPAGVGYFTGTIGELQDVLAEMPSGWTPPVTDPPVVDPPAPPAGSFEEQVITLANDMNGKLDRILEKLEC